MLSDPLEQLSAADQSQGLGLIKETLALSAHILIQEPEQLASQLTGRLADNCTRPVQDLLAGALAKSKPWLRPLSATLESTEGARYRTLIGHMDAVVALSITPDSRQIISASRDSTIRIWDIATGTEVAIIRVQPGLPGPLTVTPDGSRVIVGCSDGTIQLWERRSLNLLAVLKGHWGPVRTVRCTPDGRLIVSGSADGTLQVWDLDQLEVLHVLKGHSAAVNDLAITPDGSKAVSASSDKTLRIWSLIDGSELGIMPSSWQQFCVAIAPNGRTAVSGSEMVPISWDLERVMQTSILTDFDGPYHESDVTGVAITPDGRQVVSASSDCTLVVWDLDDQYPLHHADLTTWTSHKSVVADVAVSPNGRWAVSASHDKTILVWNLINLKSQSSRTQSTPHGNPVKWIGFGPDQEAIGLTVGYKDGKFEDDSDWKSGLWIDDHQFNWSDRARDVALSANRKILMVAVDNGIHVIDVINRKLTGERLFGVWAKVVVSSDGHIVLCYNWRASELQAWNRNTGAKVMLDPNTRSVEVLAITSDGLWGVTGTKDGNLRVWDLLDLIHTRTIKAHNGSIKTLAAAKNGSMLSCGDDGFVHLWNLVRGEPDFTFKLDWMKSNNLLISEDCRKFAAVSDQGAVMTWDLKTGRPLASFNAGSVKLSGTWNTDLSGKPLSNLVLLNRRDWAVMNNGVKITLVDLLSGIQLASFTGDSIFESCSVSPDDSKIFVGTNSGETHILSIEAHGLLNK